MSKVTEYFGSYVFDDRVMKATLSADIYASLKKTIDENASLNNDVANAVADAMKDWAISHGATHFTHWFQPLTGITAEKHDSFIAPAPDRMGSDIVRIHQGQHALHTDGILFIRRRSARPEDPAAAFHGSTEQTGIAHTAPFRQYRSKMRTHIGRTGTGIFPR